MNPWKRRFLLKTIIFRFHISFRGCSDSTSRGPFFSFQHVVTSMEPLWASDDTTPLWMSIDSYGISSKPKKVENLGFACSMLGNWMKHIFSQMVDFEWSWFTMVYTIPKKNYTKKKQIQEKGWKIASKTFKNWCYHDGFMFNMINNIDGNIWKPWRGKSLHQVPYFDLRYPAAPSRGH